MKVKYVYLALFLFLIICNRVDADTCDSDDIDRLKVIANNVTTSYSYNEDLEKEGNYGSYTLVISGLTEEIYGMIDMFDSQIYFHYDSNNLGNIEESIGSGFKTLEIYSEKCDNTLLRKIKLKIPYYNIFSDSEECDGIDGDQLEVCSKFLDKEITESVFMNEIKKYKGKQNDTLEKSISFFEKYKYLFIGIFCVIVFTIIFFVIKRIKLKNELN